MTKAQACAHFADALFNGNSLANIAGFAQFFASLHFQFVALVDQLFEQAWAVFACFFVDFLCFVVGAAVCTKASQPNAFCQFTGLRRNVFQAFLAVVAHKILQCAKRFCAAVRVELRTDAKKHDDQVGASCKA
ncbi:MAG: hypothetical protein CMN80_04710 [Spongiibacter sp.]|nr:hypothetical protein [Spongiibacter sp.]